MKNKLEEVGLNVTYKEYNIAHEISDQVIKDLSDWFTKY
jgi:predicted esterase